MRTVLIVPTRESMISSHTEKVVRELSVSLNAITQESSALLEFWRSEALHRAFACGFDVVLQMDADISGHPTEIERFARELQSNQPQVRAALFASRKPPHHPVGFQLSHLGPMTFPLQKTLRCPSNVYPGTALFGLNRAAYEQLCAVFPDVVHLGRDSTGKPLLVHPLFHTTIVGLQWFGEDYSFFRRVQEAEIPLYIDPIRLIHGFTTTHSLW